MKKQFSKVYQFYIFLDGISLPIWRRILVPETYTFWDLHVAIQDAMGWSDSHLHQFEIDHPKTGENIIIGIPDDEREGDTLAGWDTKIADYFSMDNRTAYYIYDFGDNWEHVIRLEDMLLRKENVEYPLCIEGESACPPEDCGGAPGYEQLLQTLNDPESDEYEDTIEWLGGDFDPDYFDPQDVHFDDPDERKKFALG